MIQSVEREIRNLNEIWPDVLRTLSALPPLTQSALIE